MEIFLAARALFKKICAARAYSYDENETDVCFIFCGEGVTKRVGVEATVRNVK